MPTLESGLSVLELLARHGEGLALSDIARQLDLPKSGAHRLLTTLAQRAYVRQDPNTQNYLLTLAVSALGFEFLESCGIPDICQPELDRLAALSGELVRLCIAEENGLTWVARAQGARHGLRYVPEMDIRPVLHATAVGKAWLATLPEDNAVRLAVSHPGFGQPNRFGPNAIKTTQKLLTALRESRRNGHATAVEEGALGTSAIARVVRAGANPDALVVGCVAIAGPSIRQTPTRMAELLPALIAATEELSRLWPMRRYVLAEPVSLKVEA
jgi:DNA-binding IclR family transcriptional regulator